MEQRIKNLIESQRNLRQTSSTSDTNVNIPSTFPCTPDNNIDLMKSIELRIRGLETLLDLKDRVVKLENSIDDFSSLNSTLVNLKYEVSQIAETVSNNDDIPTIPNTSPDIKMILKKIKEDLDITNRKLSTLIETNIGVTNRITTVESSNFEYLSKLNLLDGKISTSQDITLPGILSDIEKLRSRLESVKTSGEASYNSLREMMAKTNTQLVNLTGKSEKNNNELSDKISSLTKITADLKTKFDQIPFAEQILTLTNSVSSLLSNVRELSSKTDISTDDLIEIRGQYNMLRTDLNSFKELTTNEQSELMSEIIKQKNNYNKLNSDLTLSSKTLTELINTLTGNQSDNTENITNINIEVEKLKSSVKSLGNITTSTTTMISSLTKALKLLEESDKQQSTDFKTLSGSTVMSLTNQDVKIMSLNKSVSELLPLNNKVQTLSGEVAQNSTNLANLSSSTDRKISSITAMSDSLSISTQNAVGVLTRKIGSVENTQETFGPILSSLSDQVKSLVTSSNNTSTLLSTIQKQITDINVSSISEAINDLSSNIISLSDKQGSLIASQTGLQNMFQQLKSTFDNDPRFMQSNSKIATLTSMIEDLKNGVQSNNTGVSTLQSIVSEQGQELSILMGFMTTTNSKLVNIISKLTTLEGDTSNDTTIQEIKLNYNQLFSLIQDLKKNFITNADKLNSDYSGLTQRVISLEVNSGSNSTSETNMLVTMMGQIQALATGDVNTSAQVQSQGLSIQQIKTQLDSLSGSTSDPTLSGKIAQLSTSVNSLMSSNSELSSKVSSQGEMISSLQSNYGPVDTSSIPGLVHSLEKLKNNIESMMGGSMKVLPDYNILTGKSDSNSTSVQDLNTFASLIFGNQIIMTKGLKTIGQMTSDSVILGSNIPNKKGTYTLDVKGDTRFDGNLNGNAVEDLGRFPKLVKLLDVKSGVVSSFSYSGSAPNRVKVLLEGVYEIPLSRTDGFLYSFLGDKINIFPGSNSIGTTFNSQGTTTSPTMGSYHVYLY